MSIGFGIDTAKWGMQMRGKNFQTYSSVVTT